MQKSLIYIPKLKPAAKFRLICFSYAGGNISTYTAWANQLDDNYELALIQLPGRAARISEPSYTSMEQVVGDVFNEVNKLPKKYHLLFGHSMGAQVAYELTLKLFYNRCPLPLHVVVSASPAPFIRSQEQSYQLSDKDFINRLKKLNGTPTELLEDTAIMSLFLDMLRADFKIAETYCNESRLIIPTKLSVFAGTEDAISADDLQAWFQLFESNTGICWFDGGHFFIDQYNAKVLNVLTTLFER